MGAFLENQRVAKRRRTNTVKNTKYRPKNNFIGVFTRYKPKVKQTYKAAYKSKGPGFSVPLLPTLAVAAGITVIALAAFNWENINITVPASQTDLIIGQQPDGQQATLRYAATGLTDIIPAQIPQIAGGAEVEVAAVTAAVANVVAVAEPEKIDDPGQDDLITFEWQQYKVKKGDSVSAIAKKFDVSIGAIIASNDIKNARTLREGTTLRIPNIDGIPYQIKSGDSLSKIAVNHKVPLEVILDVNDIKSDHIKAGETIFIPGARMNDIDLRMSLGELFMYPVNSKVVTSRYGMRKDPINGALNFHTGIDLRADTGTTVMASLDGVVSYTGENWLYGKHIIISHDNGYKTLYAHLNSFAVKQGERVARGRKIAESGNTGYSTGPHLHFGIYDKNNKLVNPLDLLR